MRIAILGAGFSGLSTAWHLVDRGDCEVVVYDAKGIGGGASGMAAGLMHPYVGEEGRRSHLATEGMAASKELIDRVEEKLGKKVANREGILRYMLSEEQTQRYLKHCVDYGDVEPREEGCFWVKSGMTVDCPAYLHGLWELLSERGATLIQEEIACLSSLQGYDEVIIAAGAGMLKFPELSHLKCNKVKGQVLLCTVPDTVQLPSISKILKGYIAPSMTLGYCTIGSTYERGVPDDLPDPDFACSDLMPKIVPIFEEADQLKVIGCKAGARVVRRGHYFPIIAKVKSGLWVIGAMGSRGLLYHALAGKLLVEAIAVTTRTSRMSIRSCPLSTSL